MVPELEQIARDTGEFFFSYKPLILATTIAVPTVIGYGVYRLFYNPTADKYFGKVAAGLLKVTGGERALRRYISSQSKNPEKINLS